MPCLHQGLLTADFWPAIEHVLPSRTTYKVNPEEKTRLLTDKLLCLELIDSNLSCVCSNSGGAHCRPQPAGLADVDSPIHIVNLIWIMDNGIKATQPFLES